MISPTLKTIKGLTVLLWVIALVLFVWVISRTGTFTSGRQPAIRAEQQPSPSDKKSESSDVLVVFDGVGNPVGLAEIDDVKVEDNSGTGRPNCVVLTLTAPSRVISKPQGPHIQIFPQPSAERQGLPESWPRGAVDLNRAFGKRRVFASFIPDPSIFISQPSGGFDGPPLPPPPSPPPIIPPAGGGADLGGIWDRIGIYISAGLVWPAGNTLGMLNENGNLCRRPTLPAAQWGRFQDGAERLGYVGEIGTNPPLSVMVVRVCGVSPDRFQTPEWGYPRPGPATVYVPGDLSDDPSRPRWQLIREGSPDMIDEKIITINPDGSLGGAGVLFDEWNRLVNEREQVARQRVELARISQTLTLWRYLNEYLPEERRLNGIQVQLTTRITELERRMRGGNQVPIVGSPVFQNGKKVGIYMGGGQIVPIRPPLPGVDDIKRLPPADERIPDISELPRTTQPFPLPPRTP